VLKKKWIVSAIVYTIALTTVSLMTLRNIPNLGISFGDKIFHFSAYFVLTFLWAFAFFYNYNFKKAKSIQYAFFISVTFGILIEVLQETLTTVRTLDVFDMLSNTVGALLAVFVLRVYNFKPIKKL
jgi:VanZ family protein